MKIGVFSDSLAHLDRRAMFAWCAARGIADVELGVGAWGPWPRPHLFFVYNAIANRLGSPPSGRPPRPEHIATRATVAPLRPSVARD